MAAESSLAETLAPRPALDEAPPCSPTTAETLVELLEQAREVEHNGLYLIDRRERERLLSWGELADSSRRVGASLRALGIQPGERVALIYPTSEAFFRAFFGILYAGAVPVPLYPPVRLGRLDEYHRRTSAMLQAASVGLILTERRLRALLGATVEMALPALGCRLLDELPVVGKEAPADPLAADLGLVQFSSGTTVSPKPVALAHRAILAQVRALNTNWPGVLGETARGASWLPLYHDMGLIGCIFPALALHSDLALLPPEVFVARPATWLRAISRHRAHVSPAPDFAYGLCVERIRDEELDGVDLSSWRVALDGAEPISPTTLRAFCERFARWGLRPEALTPVYGLSESTLAVTFSTLDQPFRTERFDRDALASDHAVPAADGVELVSVGRPLDGTEIDIRDREARSVPHGVVGRVWTRGPSLMDGYLDRPQATAAALRDGWLDTGDLGFVHDGELFLTGRAKDVVILRGRNYAPAEIERVVDGIEGVRVGCVVAVSHRPEGADREALLLFVETRRDIAPEEREVLEARVVEAVLGAVGLKVDAVVALEPGSLPRTSSGKLRRREALERFLAGDLGAPERVTPWLLGKAFASSGVAWTRAWWKRRRA
ncbi:MAG: fatty acyl-AMP ligase [Acidobacteriota bacterium]